MMDEIIKKLKLVGLKVQKIEGTNKVIIEEDDLRDMYNEATEDR